MGLWARGLGSGVTELHFQLSVRIMAGVDVMYVRPCGNVWWSRAAVHGATVPLLDAFLLFCPCSLVTFYLFPIWALCSWNTGSWLMHSVFVRRASSLEGIYLLLLCSFTVLADQPWYFQIPIHLLFSQKFWIVSLPLIMWIWKLKEL